MGVVDITEIWVNCFESLKQNNAWSWRVKLGSSSIAEVFRSEAPALLSSGEPPKLQGRAILFLFRRPSQVSNILFLM
jgi:hypothetical protein